MEILYKCRCLDTEAKVTVRDRVVTDDVLDWMEMVARVVSADHAQRSPTCPEVKMEYLKIPHPENATHVGIKPITN